MSGSGRGSRPAPRKTPSRGPSLSLSSAGLPTAAILSAIGLLVVAFVTLGLTNGDLPFVSSNGGGSGPDASDNPAVQRTPTPSNVVIVATPEPGTQLPGTLVYAKDGNIWLQDADSASQLTTGGNDSMPAFAPDGQSVFFVRTRRVNGKWPIAGTVKDYRLDVPTLMQVPVSGGKPTSILDGIVNPPGSYKWSGFIREPAISPDGRYVAIATDLPDPTTSDVVIKLYDLKTDKIKDLKLDQVPPLGHQDPAWKPDGSRLLYVRNDRDGAKGASRLYLYNPDTGKAKAVTGPGYLYPSWSPDGRYIAATRTNAYGTDVVILDGSTGAELAKLTNDGNSWAPIWSPKGDQIAYLHVVGQVIDLRMIQLEGTGPSWTASDPIDLTDNAGLDGVSRPGWFIPQDQLPTPTPAPTEGPAGSPAGS
jgi:Tol biopolymer transport system component